MVRKFSFTENYFLSPKKSYVSFLGLFIFEVTFLTRELSLVPYMALLIFLSLNDVKLEKR
jgi:hypothetical protein